jgi:very-short-patch-repair endonuclease
VGAVDTRDCSDTARARSRQEDVTRRKAIPVTTPGRTIADIKRTLVASEVRRATRQAEVLGLWLGPARAGDGTRSELEHRFLVLCRRHRLPKPEVNAALGGFVVDFLWRDRRLVAETDGYRYHRGAQAFEDDRSRDLQLRTLGFDVLRFSYRQVTEDGAAVARALRALLS